MSSRLAARANVAAIAAMQKASLVETYEPFLGRAAIDSALLRAAESKAAVGSDELTLEVWERKALRARPRS